MRNGLQAREAREALIMLKKEAGTTDRRAFIDHLRHSLPTMRRGFDQAPVLLGFAPARPGKPSRDPQQCGCHLRSAVLGLPLCN